MQATLSPLPGARHPGKTKWEGVGGLLAAGRTGCEGGTPERTARPESAHLEADLRCFLSLERLRDRRLDRDLDRVRLLLPVVDTSHRLADASVASVPPATKAPRQTLSQTQSGLRQVKNPVATPSRAVCLQRCAHGGRKKDDIAA